MARQLVEAFTRGQVRGTIPDVNPVDLLPGPASDALGGRDGTNGIIAEAYTALTAPGVLVNPEVAPNDHTFNFTLEGVDVPGAPLNLNPLFGGAIAPVTVAAGASLPFALGLLVGDQKIVATMQEVVVASAPYWSWSYEDRFSPLDKLSVAREKPGNQIALVNDQTPFVIDGPDGFSAREIAFAAAPFRTFFVNQDTVQHDVTVTLKDPVNGDQVLASAVAVASGGFLSSGLLPGRMNLLEGQSIEIATATPTTTTDPYCWANFIDRV